MVLWMALTSLFPDHNATGVRRFDDYETQIFRGFTTWDSAHYLGIATKGALLETDAAFFPLYPWVVRMFGRGTVFGAVMISNVAFIVAAGAVERASTALVGPVHGHRAALAFIVNPASVFSSTAYAESLFACLTFHGIASLVDRRKCLATLCFFLAAATRANGCLLAIYPLLVDSSLLSALIIASPPILRDAIAYLHHCPGSGWCHETWSLYTHVQRSHWGSLGLFSYWQAKQLPNFLLATPAVIIAVGAGLASWSRLRRRRRRHDGVVDFFFFFCVPTSSATTTPLARIASTSPPHSTRRQPSVSSFSSPTSRLQRGSSPTAPSRSSGPSGTRWPRTDSAGGPGATSSSTTSSVPLPTSTSSPGLDTPSSLAWVRPSVVVADHRRQISRDNRLSSPVWRVVPASHTEKNSQSLWCDVSYRLALPPYRGVTRWINPCIKPLRSRTPETIRVIKSS